MPESFKEDGRPAQQWYWDDWFSAFDVRLCSLAARGLWIDMLGIMFKAEIRGTLTVNGKQINSKTLAKIIGGKKGDVDKYLKELENNDVFSRLEDGTVICRRMFNESGRKDEISRIRREVGKKGAEARWQTNGKNDGKNMAKMAASSPTPTPTSTATSSSKNNSLKNISDEDRRLTQLLIDLMLGNDPNSSIIRKLTEKRQIEWMDECRKLREIDKRSPELIEKIIHFSQEDEFWKGNVLSMSTLRKKFDQLFLKAKKTKFSGIKEWLNESRK